MKHLNIEINQLVKDIGGTFVNKEKCLPFIKSLSIDSRTLQGGQWFLCLRGENFDAHDFIEAILEKKPAGIIFSNSYAQAQNLYGIAVDNPNQYLGELASWWRTKVDPLVLAVTGSNGKTSTKEILAHLLTSSSNQVVATKDNLNNQFGVPLTLLSIQETTKYVVVELGSNHRGEISQLSQWAKPNFAIIVSIAEGHIGNFKTIAEIAQEKASIVDGLQKEGLLYLSPKISQLPIIQSYCLQNNKPIQFSQEYLQAICFDQQGTWFLHQQEQCYLPFAGNHQFANLQLVFSLLHNIFELATLQKMLTSLKSLQPVAGRLQLLPSSNKNIKVWDDSYNANLASFEAAIGFLQKQHNPNIVLLAAVGHMAELGDKAEQAHFELAVLLEQAGFTAVAFFSNQKNYHSAFEEGWQTSCNRQKEKQKTRYLQLFLPQQKKEAATFLLKVTPKKQTKEIHVLVKGSHSMHMQEIFPFLLDF